MKENRKFEIPNIKQAPMVEIQNSKRLSPVVWVIGIIGFWNLFGILIL